MNMFIYVGDINVYVKSRSVLSGVITGRSDFNMRKKRKNHKEKCKKVGGCRVKL